MWPVSILAKTVRQSGQAHRSKAPRQGPVRPSATPWRSRSCGIRQPVHGPARPRAPTVDKATHAISQKGGEIGGADAKPVVMGIKSKVQHPIQGTGPNPIAHRIGVPGRAALFVRTPAGAYQLPGLGIFGACHRGPGGAVQRGRKLKRAAKFLRGANAGCRTRPHRTWAI